jgi:hypothetical protein
MTRCTLSAPVPASIFGAPALPNPAASAQHALHPHGIGRAASACSWARRSLDAATIFMAEVILRVFFTLLMRTRRSLRLGIGCGSLS